MSSLTAVLVGGGTIPLNLLKASSTFLPVHTTYGMTELGSQLTTTPPKSSLIVLDLLGNPLGDWQIQIASNEEIQVQGSPLFLGYWNGSFIEDPREIQMDGLAQMIVARL